MKRLAEGAPRITHGDKLYFPAARLHKRDYIALSCPHRPLFGAAAARSPRHLGALSRRGAWASVLSAARAAARADQSAAQNRGGRTPAHRHPRPGDPLVLRQPGRNRVSRGSASRLRPCGTMSHSAHVRSRPRRSARLRARAGGRASTARDASRPRARRDREDHGRVGPAGVCVS